MNRLRSFLFSETFDSSAYQIHASFYAGGAVDQKIIVFTVSPCVSRDVFVVRGSGGVGTADISLRRLRIVAVFLADAANFDFIGSIDKYSQNIGIISEP